MRILVLGGTAFVGRAIAKDALRSGAQVTLFGRGKTGTGLFPGVVRLTGDRDTGDYAALGADGVGPGSIEETPRRPPVRDTEELSNETYGPLKVACEDDVVARWRCPATRASPSRSSTRGTWPGWWCN